MQILKRTNSRLVIGTPNVGQSWKKKAIFAVVWAVVVGSLLALPLHAAIASLDDVESWLSSALLTVIMVFAVILLVRIIFACFEETELIFDKNTRTLNYRKSIFSPGNRKEQEFSFADISKFYIEEELRVTRNTKNRRRTSFTYHVKLLLTVPPHSLTLFSGSNRKTVTKKGIAVCQFVECSKIEF